MTRIPITCEYGYPQLCGKLAIYECWAKGYPYPMYACEEHARLMQGYHTTPIKGSWYYETNT